MKLSKLQTKSSSRSFTIELFKPAPWLWLATLATAVTVYLLGVIGLLNPINRVLEAQMNGAKSAVYQFITGANAYFSAVGRIPELNAEINRLKQQNLELQSNLSRAEPIFAQNEQLISELGIKYERDYALIGAQVIGFQLSEPDTILINKGKLDDVEVGDVAVVQRILVGKVVEVSDYSARVRLVTNAKQSLPGRTTARDVGLITGAGGSSIKLTQVLQTQDLPAGTKIFTSGINAEFPPNLLVGEVVTVAEDPRASTKEALLRSPLDLSELLYLKVIKFRL